MSINNPRGCKCCGPSESYTEVTEYIYEEEEESSNALTNIWRDKMLKSGLFLDTEVNQILPIWKQFIQKLLEEPSEISAGDFYINTATLCAHKLKRYSIDGWECLITDYPPSALKCLDINDLEEQEVKDLSVASEESVCDIHTQLEFLLQLVASSNLNLYLVRLAIAKNFNPNFNDAKSPNNLLTPRPYLDINLQNLEKEEIRKNLIYGVYDGHILPLKIASEVNEEFWQKEIAEITAIPRFSRFHSQVDNPFENVHQQ